MQVLVPISISDDMLVSSTALEPAAGEAAWVATESYTANVVVYLPSTHRRYRASVDITGAADNPSPDDATVFPPKWADIGPTNRWAMFDREVNTQTAVAGEALTVVLTPGAFNSIALFGLDGGDIEIKVLDKPGGVEIFHYQGSLEDSAPSDYWEYFFSPFKLQTDLVLSGIPTFMNAEITITISSAGGAAKVGMLALGDLRALGKTLYGARAKLVDYSYVKTDEFGNTSIKKRKNSKDMSAEVWLKLSEANSVIDTLTELLGIPCIYLATDGPQYSGLRAFGLGSGEISYDHPQDCMLHLTVKGLI